MAKLESFGVSNKVKVMTVLVAIGGIIFLSILMKCLVSVPANHVAIVIKKTGKNLPKGKIVAPDSGYAGVQREVLTTGYHIINPINDVKILPATTIPAGSIGILKLKVGKTPKNPDSTVVEDGERGIQRKFLNSGVHFLNPYMYDVEVTPITTIPAGKMGIVTRMVGKDPKNPGDILVETGERGIQREVITPGAVFLNPYIKKVKIVDAIQIPAGQMGVVTSKTGRPSNDDLVEKGERGVWREVLRPGTHYMNTKGYSVAIHPAVQIDAGFVGVVVRRTGKPPKVANAIVVARGERGVQPYTLPAGLHYINPYEFKVISVDTRTQKYEMSQMDTTLDTGEVAGDDRIAFPSADGFTIKVDTSIEWQIQTNRIPEVVASIGNTPEIVRKVLRPNARAIGRLEGSKLKAEEFIKGDKREQFVQNFSDMLKKVCAEKGIVIHKALVREVEPPEEVAKPLKEREVALLMQKTNEEKQRQAESEAMLAEEHEKIEQRRRVVQAETEKKVAETQANREKEVAKIKAEQLKEVAAIEREKQEEILARQKLEAQGIKAIADAKAYEANQLIRADGALDKKLRAWTDVMKIWASNPHLVPKIVVSGGGGAGQGDLTGQELILQLLAIERLERFANSDLGNLETKPFVQAPGPPSP